MVPAPLSCNLRVPTLEVTVLIAESIVPNAIVATTVEVPAVLITTSAPVVNAPEAVRITTRLTAPSTPFFRYPVTDP